jgi:hypothetical protein
LKMERDRREKKRKMHLQRELEKRKFAQEKKMEKLERKARLEICASADEYDAELSFGGAD